MATVVRYHNPHTERDIRRKWARDLLVQCAEQGHVGPALEVHCGESVVQVEAIGGLLFVGDDYDTGDGNAALIMGEFMVRRMEARNGRSPGPGVP